MKKYYIMLAALTIFVGCGNSATHAHGSEEHEGHEEHAHDHDHEEHGGHGHGPGIIEFTEAQAESAGLTTETVTPSSFSSTIRTGGEILPAPGDEKTVVATTSGIISISDAGAALIPGARLAKGSPVAVISARDMADGDPVAKSRAVYESAAKEYGRAESLMKSNSISRKAYEQAKRDYEIARAEFDAYSGKAGDKGLSVLSPLSGYVKQVFVNDGDYVAAGAPIAVVTGNRRLQLRADVPERYYAVIPKIVSANFRPSCSSESYSVRDLGGRVAACGRAASSGSFYIPVTFEFDNRGSFVPGAFCDIWLISDTRENVISVPETALTEEQGIYFVYLKVCGTEYRKQEVRIGETDGIRREILSGLEPGDEVVASGAMQVKLASVKGSIPGHTHNH